MWIFFFLERHVTLDESYITDQQIKRRIKIPAIDRPIYPRASLASGKKEILKSSLFPNSLWSGEWFDSEEWDISGQPGMQARHLRMPYVDTSDIKWLIGGSASLLGACPVGITLSPPRIAPLVLVLSLSWVDLQVVQVVGTELVFREIHDTPDFVRFYPPLDVTN